MKRKAIGLVAAVGILGTALAFPLVAQEDKAAPEEKAAAEQLIRVMRYGQGSYLGVFISDVSAEDVARLNLREESGVLVTGVADDGPASEAGLLKDDVIVGWSGERVQSEAQLRRLLGETPAGRTVQLGVFRGGSERTISVKLGESGGGGVLRLRSEWNEEHAQRLRDRMRDMDVRIRGVPHVATVVAMRGGRLGVGIQNLGPQLAEYFGLGDRSGVLITTVRDESPAANAGLKAGDVIISVDGEAVEGPADLSKMVMSAEAGPVAIRVLRDRTERTITVELPEAKSVWESEDGEGLSLFFSPEGESGDLDMRWTPFDGELEGPQVLRLDGAPHVEELFLPRLRALPEVSEIGQPPRVPVSPAELSGRRRVSI